MASLEKSCRIFLAGSIVFGLASGICADLGYNGSALWTAIFAFLSMGGLANVVSEARAADANEQEDPRHG